MSDGADGGARKRLGVLVSGRGSNLQALIDAQQRGHLQATVEVVISNVAEAPALSKASAAGIETLVASHRGWPSREAYDEHLADALNARRLDLLCLAGFMRRLSARFFEHFSKPVLNVHPSLLPAFPGVDGPGQALSHGAKVAGCTVHLVTPALDDGPIVLQSAVPILASDSVESLAARILVEEHRLLPEAANRVLAGGWRLEGRRFIER